MNNENYEVKRFEFGNGTEILVSSRVADKTIMLDVVDTDSDGDWVYCRISVEQARKFALLILNTCEVLEGGNAV